MHSLAPGAEAGAHRSLVLAVYVERFAKGRRVAVFGDVTTGLAEALGARGARVVHAYDSDAARVAKALALEPPRNVSFAHLASNDLGVRDNAFDVTIVPDLTYFPDPKALLARVRQATAQGGVVLVASPNAGESGDRALGYYDFYDAVALQFAEVKMVGQVPFAGYALVDFSLDGEPEVAVDTSLVSDIDPTFYIALASDKPFTVDPYSIVQLATLAAEPPPPHDDSELRAALAEAEAGRHAAKADLDVTRDARRALEARLDAEQRKVTELTRAISDGDALPRRLEAKLAEETRRTAVANAQLAKLEAELAKSAAELAQARAEHAKTVEASRTRVASQDAELAKARDALAKPRDPSDRPETTRALADATRALAEATRSLVDAKAEVSRLALRDGELVQKLAASDAKLAAAASAPRVDPVAHEASVARVASLEARLHAATKDSGADADHATEVGKLEAILRERAHEITSLRREVDRRGALVRELLETLEQARPEANRLTATAEHLLSVPARLVARARDQ